jgi:fumarate hydratase class II
MGEVRVPADAYYGASTQRAVENFPISGIRFGRRFIWALGLIKGSAAAVAGREGHLDPAKAEAIRAAADEVMDGRLDEQFVLDIFQTGSGTSTNTNANEVIAGRATEILGAGAEGRVHPNDDVNFGQSSNDVIPTAIHIAAVAAIREDLIPALERLAASLEAKSTEFADIVKSGRTHLMDATPVTLGQEFGGWAAQVRKGVERLAKVLPELEELALGGTAVGTGINAPPGFAAAVIALMAERTGFPLREAEDHFEAQGAKDAAVMASGALKTIAVSMFKIANDIRFLGSGPTAGLAEIRIPDLQPGSSIMPGKVNPVIPEVINQIAYEVIGNDVTVSFAAEAGQLQLNAFEPIIAHSLFDSLHHLRNGCLTLSERCVDGITANRERLHEMVTHSIGLITALNPYIGYTNATEIAQEALATGGSVADLVLERGLLTKEQLAEILRPDLLTQPRPLIEGEKNPK